MNLFTDHSPTAILSPCRRYRYTLTRTWDERPPVVFVGVNPSTADADVDDATIRRCCSFARMWGYGGIVMLNLFALRSTDPKALYADPSSAIGPQNDEYLATETRGRDVISAWGVHGKLAGRDAEVMKIIRRDRLLPVRCLGTTRDGHPRHPLYLAADTARVEFPFPADP